MSASFSSINSSINGNRWTRSFSRAVITAAVFGALALAGCVEDEDDPDPGPGPGGNDVTFTDSRGNEIVIPYGATSCATRVVDFTAGSPWTSDPLDMDPNESLGAPDRGDATNGKAITLGVDGVIVLEFGVHITDGPGLDIYVFEVGNAVEATKVEVSDNLETWIHVGDAAGSLSGVDMNGKIPAGGKYRYVRLTDLRTSPSGSWPGADIDATCALNPILL